MLAMVCGFAAAQAQDTAFARQIIKELSAPKMKGRGASYGADSAAACYIRTKLRRSGVDPLYENYFQEFTYSTFAMEGPCWMEVDGQKLVNGKDFRFTPWSKSIHNASQEVVTLPLETYLDSKKLQQFVTKHEGMLSDCFVYINTTSMKAKDQEEQKRIRQELNRLKRRNPFGSRGIMLGVEKLSTASLSGCEQEHGYTFVEVVASKLPKKVKEVGVCVTTQFRPNHIGRNVCAIVPGEVDSMIVFTAHYDHLGTMGDGYKVRTADGEVKEVGSLCFPGAHDNASGVAALMDLARMATQEKPHYTQIYLFFTGEEAGLKGSTYFAEHPLIDLSKVKLLINIDLFCGGENGLMVFNATDEKTKPFFERMKVLNDALQIAPELRARPNSPNSDHAPFVGKCPAMYVLTLGGPYGGYHVPEDVCEKCSLENYNNYLLLISSLAL